MPSSTCNPALNHAVSDAVLADRIATLLADVPGLRLAAHGEPAHVTVVSHPAIPAAAPSDGSVGFTPRKTEVLALPAEGASNKLITWRLGISVHTAKFHVGSLLDKPDATGRTDAGAHAAWLGVIRL